MRGKEFELLDIPKFAAPSISDLKALPTSGALSDRLGGPGFMSYGQIWPRIGEMVRDGASEDFISRAFGSYKANWKNESIRDAFRLLTGHLGGKGRWYRERSTSRYVLGVWFRPCIKGIWFSEGRPYAVLVNARKGQPLTATDVAFLARGVYEFHCIDDPNDPIPLIIDLSETERGKGRQLRTFSVSPEDAVSLPLFEATLKEFFVALSMAGVALPPAPTDHVADFLRSRRL